MRTDSDDSMSWGRRIWWIAVLTALASAVVLTLSGPLEAATSPSAAPRPVTPRGELAADEKSTIALFEQTRDSVVFISTSSVVQDFWSRNVLSVPRGTGSGFIWDDAGHVVTNYHVIEGASEATVKLADGTDYKSTLVGASPSHDIAVLKIVSGYKHPTPVPLGTSHDLRVGQKVFAIGNPCGLDWTLTSGLVSALNRSLPGERGSLVEHLIQTDAAINPGNSGGPLLDSAGRLIGINTAIYSPSGTSAGIGFAVPVDTVNRVVPQLIRLGKYVRPSLGLRMDEDLNQRLVRALKVRGVVVLQSAAGRLAPGLQEATLTRDGNIFVGDIIMAVNGKPTETVRQLALLLDEMKVGDTVTLSLLRKGKPAVLEAKLQAGN
ncbi:MAG: 2-alkenal reductase [Burkholderiales bacterium PBB4]|nr:MAG: 2-alkenal reductase [Burkholderiales bacterium PBB4]